MSASALTGATRYRAILADPPWHFRARTALQVGNWTSRRDAEKHYPVMGIEDIKALPVREMADKDAHLFLWTTGPNLPKAFDVIEAWGFRYSAIAFTWVKLKRSFDPRQIRVVALAESDLHVGLGLTTRKNAEFCLLGRRGSARRNSRKVREIILAPVREHSRKPDEQYDRIEEYCDGPYLELFARQAWPGWDAWGDEVGKFDADNQQLAGAAHG
ncbi:MAG: DNA methyltransferase [Alphaproteobacteria bacterium]|nr:DNA methyltransferase [Alphaproteobacteria bacterium]